MASPSSEITLLTAARYVRQKSPDMDFPGVVRGVQKIVGKKYGEDAIAEAYKDFYL